MCVCVRVCTCARACVCVSVYLGGLALGMSVIPEDFLLQRQLWDCLPWALSFSGSMTSRLPNPGSSSHTCACPGHGTRKIRSKAPGPLPMQMPSHIWSPGWGPTFLRPNRFQIRPQDHSWPRGGRSGPQGGGRLEGHGVGGDLAVQEGDLGGSQGCSAAAPGRTGTPPGGLHVGQPRWGGRGVSLQAKGSSGDQS